MSGDSMEQHSLSDLPWQVSRDALLAAARDIDRGGAFVVFVIDDQIPDAARSGYAALVIAYARADEPVCILADGTAVLLIRDGGTTAARVAADRLLRQMRRLGLERTLRVGVVALAGDVERQLGSATDAARAAGAGEVSLAT